jgi:uncharacterized membrane protein
MKIKLSIHNVILLQLAFVGLLIAARVAYSGQIRFVFLIWNLFLAWLPLAISMLFAKPVSTVKHWILFACWLLFFPNALYIITDLIHLKETGGVPLWYDAILLFAAAITGLIAGLVSLHYAEKFLTKRFTHKTVQIIIAAIFFISSFGVYLGRFLRWNSWDVVTNPVGLFYEIAHRFVFPLQHYRTWGVTCILGIFLYLLWLLIKKIPGFQNQVSIKQDI